MRKVYALFPAFIFICSAAAIAQSEKKEPSPPPKSVNEKVKLTPPKIVKDKEVQMKEPPPPPQEPKDEIAKSTPPKIVVDEKVQVKEPPVITAKDNVAVEFYKQTPSVTDVQRQGNITTLKKQDGTNEKYYVNKKREDKSYSEKYRVSPIIPTAPKPKTKA